ncbi:MAG: Maf family protein [Acutalibacteraceae bacterium]|jgi:septum formation protein
MGKIILASASPRRRELFSLITKDFTVIPSTAEEIVPDGVEILKYAEYLAAQKAREIAAKYPENVVVGADTAVIAEGIILGKPKNKQDAKRMINLLSGKTHRVVTGCAVIKGSKFHSFSSVTEVEFYALYDDEIERYINTDEPYDKAGGYGIQGGAALFVKKICGDYFNVVGLPVAQLYHLLKNENYI